MVRRGSTVRVRQRACFTKGTARKWAVFLLPIMKPETTSMLRRGSAVRVRQRASAEVPANAGMALPVETRVPA